MIAMMISESHGRMMLTLALRLPMQKWRRLRVRFQLALMPENAEPPERPPPGDFSALALSDNNFRTWLQKECPESHGFQHDAARSFLSGPPV